MFRVSFSRRKRRPKLRIPCIPLNHQVTFRSLLTYTGVTIDGGHTHCSPDGHLGHQGDRPICESRKLTANVNDCGRSRSIFDRFVAHLHHVRSISHVHFDIADQPIIPTVQPPMFSGRCRRQQRSSRGLQSCALLRGASGQPCFSAIIARMRRGTWALGANTTRHYSA